MNGESEVIAEGERGPGARPLGERGQGINARETGEE